MVLNHSFKGKTILITGGGKGVGKNLIKRLYEDGATLLTVDRDADALKELKAEFPNVKTALLDLSDWEKTKNVIGDLIGDGPIDHLVNNAGILINEDFLEMKPESLKKIFDVNLFAMINVGQVVAKKMIDKQSGGSMVNLSSLAGHVTCPGILNYSMTKSAIMMLTKGMSIELGPHNIRVNCICPTGIATGLMAELPATAGPIVARAVIKRPVTTDEAADLILFLLSPLSAMVTGSNYNLDGGVLTC